MFACLYLPRRADSAPDRGKGQGERGIPHDATLLQIARDFSPRVETHGDRTVTLDISGLGSLIGEPRAIGEELRRTAADAGLGVHIAIAASSTAAILLAHARAGLTVVARGDEAAALAPLPLRILTQLGFGLWLLDSGLGPQPKAWSLNLEPEAWSPKSTSSTAGACVLSAIWRPSLPVSSPRVSARPASVGSVGRAAKRCGRSFRPAWRSRSRNRSTSNGRSTGSNRCPSSWRGCSSRYAIGSSAAIAARSCCASP